VKRDGKAGSREGGDARRGDARRDKISRGLSQMGTMRQFDESVSIERKARECERERKRRGRGEEVLEREGRVSAQFVGPSGSQVRVVDVVGPEE